jgi:hypothetical protein
MLVLIGGNVFVSVLVTLSFLHGLCAPNPSMIPVFLEDPNAACFSLVNHNPLESRGYWHLTGGCSHLA